MPAGGQLVTFPAAFGPADWTEEFSMSSPNQYGLTQTKGDVTVVGNISWDLILPCIQWLLGYAYVDVNKKLRRVLPQRHPRLPWLWCNGITNITGKGLTQDHPNLTSPSAFPGGINSGNYDRALVYASFGPTTYDILNDVAANVDGNPIKEYERFCTVKCDPFVELLTLPNGSLLYNAPYAAGAAIDGNPIISPQVRIRQEKDRFTLTWYLVPLDFICDKYGVPTKLLSAQKCVNKVDFLGQPAGTLMCEKISYDLGVFPIASTVVGKNQLCAEKIVFDLLRFDPPRDVDETKRGWNLWPTNLPSGIYVGAKQGGGAGVDAYKEFNFEDCFTHQSLAPT